MSKQKFEPSRGAFWLAASLIVALAAWVRLRGLGDFSLTLDEITLVDFANGVLQRGYPSIFVGSMEVPLATYELVPYFMALSIKLFGFSEFSVRLPAALFGTATAFLVFATAWRIFGWKVGMLAGGLYSISAWATYWAQNSFHPQQTQFFVMLTAIMAHRILSADQIRARDCYLMAIFFSLGYLSWEGSGFLLLILFFVALFTRWGRWDWMTYRHIWGAVALVVAVVVAQGVRRVMLQVDYLMVGSGKSDVSLPQLVFMKPSYSPYYYLVNFFGMEAHLVLSAVFILGLPFIIRDWNLRFFYVFTLVAWASMTNFLGYYNPHYIYYLLPMFLIATSAATMRLLIVLLEKRPPVLPSATLANKVLAGMALLFILFSASPGWFKPYRLGSLYQDPKRVDIRPNLAGIDYRGAAAFLKQHYRPGDVIIAASPSTLRIYSGLSGDYFLQSVTDRKVIYDPNTMVPNYRDKFVGNPVLRNRRDLEALLLRSPRVWLYAAPYQGFKLIIDEDIRDLLDHRMNLVWEGHDAKVFLWGRL
jgi:4-amino-4-deoxy-L-arabinose transferase-like glycosyltransferase